MNEEVTQLDLTRTANEARDPVVVFEHVSIGFNGVPVLEDVSFAVQPRETRILLGPAGVGKSVLLKLANGLLKPDAGRIYLFGRELTDLTEDELLALRVRTGMVFQEGALFDSLTVRDNVGYQLMERLLPEAEIDSRVHEALRFVELEHTFAMLPASLSGGMRRRVAIARAIIDRPDMLLYDSPTGGLDPVTSATIVELVVKQRDVYRTPSLLVTHRLQDAFTMCSHRYDDAAGKMAPLAHGELDEKTSFLVLHAGRLIFDGTTAELVRSEDPFLKEFLA
ncbi:MAG TPA: ATP-binding cassette domain-containing protein [Acidobacteriaceae bacterium]|nr:ATP-binding cassette domain-containing protein [Acidobacteriaceae bacterium]